MIKCSIVAAGTLAVKSAGDHHVNCHLWLLQNIYSLRFSLLQRKKKEIPEHLVSKRGREQFCDQKIKALGGREEAVLKKGGKKVRSRVTRWIWEHYKSERQCWRDQRKLQSLAKASNLLAAYP